LEEPTHLSDTEAFRESSLNGLVELQRFLAQELEELEIAPAAFQKAFRPLTDGLGLETPKRREDSSALSVKPLSTPDINQLFFHEPENLEPNLAPSPLAGGAEPNRVSLDDVKYAERKAKEASHPGIAFPSAHDATLEMVSPALPAEIAAPRIATPPPMPQPSLFRRLQAALIDDVFVLAIWVFTLVITANLLTGFSEGFSIQVLQEFSRPIFLRFAALEFATLWLAYFAIGIGVLDMTFGMWVWGIRVCYDPPESSRFARKVLRIVLSFLFIAPIVPAIFLLFRIRGRNLLDSLSGTGLYRSGL